MWLKLGLATSISCPSRRGVQEASESRLRSAHYFRRAKGRTHVHRIRTAIDDNLLSIWGPRTYATQVRASQGAGVVHITKMLGTQEHLKAKLNAELNSQGISVVGTLTIIPHTQTGNVQRVSPAAQRNAVNALDFWAEVDSALMQHWVLFLSSFAGVEGAKNAKS